MQDAGHDTIFVGDLGFDELRRVFARLRERPSRDGQVFRGLNRGGAAALADIPGLSRRVVARLEGRVRLRQLTPAGQVASPDGTRKLVYRTARGEPVEAVLFPMARRQSVCLSSQTGCRVGCAFCRTGSLTVRPRNLRAGEILDPLRDALAALGDPRAVGNVVFMGMGEPLLNYTQVVRAIGILTHEAGLQLARDRITVSTAGVAPLIPRLGAETGVNLALSLVCADDALRDRLVPINRRWPLASLRRALDAYPLRGNQRLTVEVPLLAGVNDAPAQAREVGAFLAGLPVKLNLIPWNGWPGAPFARPDDARVQAYAQALKDAGYAVQIRARKGDDVAAACGQLGATLDPGGPSL